MHDVFFFLSFFLSFFFNQHLTWGLGRKSTNVFHDILEFSTKIKLKGLIFSLDYIVYI